MTALNNREWLLMKRPVGQPQMSDFEFREGPAREPGAGEVLVQCLYAIMDPAIRGWMDASGNYFTPIALGGPVTSVVLGRVIKSNSPDLQEGALVSGLGSWSEYITAPAAAFGPVTNPDRHETEAFLHPLGAVGLTVHYGLFHVANVKPGDNLLVSGAGGGVGMLVAQMAKLKGAKRVVGIAGGSAKCAQAVRDFGYDACIDYKAESDLGAAITRELPAGFDVYFENVGGKTLEAALDNMAKNARIVVCGMIAGYNATEKSPGPNNLWNLLVKTASIQGFLVADFFGDPAAAKSYEEISDWLAAGKLRYKVDVREGIENVPTVFNHLFSGAHDGKLVVRIA